MPRGSAPASITKGVDQHVSRRKRPENSDIRADVQGLANELGKPLDEVRDLLARYGIYDSTADITADLLAEQHAEDVVWAARLFAEGKSAKQIAAGSAVRLSYVQDLLREAGVMRRGGGRKRG